MLIPVLVSEFEGLFQREKRARVCLWFDEKHEFARLLPALHAHLRTQLAAPFSLLVYDPGSYHGQLWIRHQIYRSLAPAGDGPQAARRFVVYLPLSEDRLDRPGEDRTPPLELLQEYRIAGTPPWRIGGKRPTLFSFLRQAGVQLPERPAEQRRLYEGGADSLLAKYAAKFADRPREFWAMTLTPELAQSRLLGDVDQTLLELAVDPLEVKSRLEEQGLLREFLDLCGEHYGYAAPFDDPASWVKNFVATLALTETYLSYQEPADFPYVERLPPLALRSHDQRFLRRWLRDAEYRPAWDRWILEVERDIDLSRWAKDRPGMSFGFPHLGRLRSARALAAFEAAAPKTSDTLAFFQQHKETIAAEVEFGKASQSTTFAWPVLHLLGGLIGECQKAEERIPQEQSAAGLARLYAELAPEIEGRHVRLRFAAMEHGLPTVGRVADRHYADYANALNHAFFSHYSQQDDPQIVGLPPVTAHLQQHLWARKGKRAVILADALRYDCAGAIKDLLGPKDVQVHPVQAMLPTVTAMGMTALLPLAAGRPMLEVQGNTLHLKLGGKDLAARENRLSFLRSFGAECREILDVEETAEGPKTLKELLVIFGHEEVDKIGHGNAEALIRHVDREVERLARLVRKLHQWGYPEVHIVTDHGFMMLDEAKLPPEVTCKKEWCVLLKERYALIAAGADVPVKSFAHPWDDALRIAVPPGLAFFKAEKSFSHGGAALQELVIPHLVSRVSVGTRRLEVTVSVPSVEITQSLVRVVLQVRPPEGQMLLSIGEEASRTVTLDVLHGERSVLTGPKEVHLGAAGVDSKGSEHKVTLFFRTMPDLSPGAVLDLVVKDAETGEHLSPGRKLTIMRHL